MRPSPRPASIMLINTEVVEVAVASMSQDTMKGKEDKIIALFLPSKSARSPPIKQVDDDDNAHIVAGKPSNNENKDLNFTDPAKKHLLETSSNLNHLLAVVFRPI